MFTILQWAQRREQKEVLIKRRTPHVHQVSQVANALRLAHRIKCPLQSRYQRYCPLLRHSLHLGFECRLIHRLAPCLGSLHFLKALAALEKMKNLSYQPTGERTFDSQYLGQLLGQKILAR